MWQAETKGSRRPGRGQNQSTWEGLEGLGTHPREWMQKGELMESEVSGEGAQGSQHIPRAVEPGRAAGVRVRSCSTEH